LEATTNPAFGHSVFGLDLYVWGMVVFALVILATAVALMFRSQLEPVKEEPEWLRRLAAIGAGALFVVAALQTGSVFLECGLGDCPNDGGWNWWAFR
jgi:RsiW-degrading membrane proteinase PrsW (M82 family)